MKNKCYINVKTGKRSLCVKSTAFFDSKIVFTKNKKFNNIGKRRKNGTN